MANVYNSRYFTAEEIDERLKLSLYLDVKAKGYEGTFDEFVSGLMKVSSGSGEAENGFVDVSDILGKLNLEDGGTMDSGDFQTLKGYLSERKMLCVTSIGEGEPAIAPCSYNIDRSSNMAIISCIVPSERSRRSHISSYNFIISLDTGKYYGMNDETYGYMVDQIIPFESEVTQRCQMNEYEVPDKYSAISSKDTISSAIGKLEAGLKSGSDNSSDNFLDITEIFNQIPGMQGSQKEIVISDDLFKKISKAFAEKTTVGTINIDNFTCSFPLSIHKIYGSLYQMAVFCNDPLVSNMYTNQAGYMMLHITIEISNKEAVLSRYTIPFGEGANLYTIDFEVDIKGASNNNIDTSGTIETRKWAELKPILEHCVSAGQGILLSTKSNSLYCSVKQKEETYCITGMSCSLSRSSSPLNIDWIYIEIQDNGKTIPYLTNLGKSHSLTLYNNGDGDYFLSDSGEYKKMPDILFFEEQAEKVIALEKKVAALEKKVNELGGGS